MLLCVDTPFPTFDEIYNQIKDSLTHPPLFADISVPKIISTLQEKMFSTVDTVTGKVKSVIRSVNMEMVFLAQEFSNITFWGLLKKIVEPLLKIVGVSLRLIFPVIPGIGISITDILTGNITPADVYNKIKEAITNKLHTLWSFVPWPFNFNLNIPDIDVVQIFQLILKEYMQMVLDKIKWLINTVMLIMDIIHPTLLAFHAAWILFTEKVLPLFPNFSDMVDSLYTKVKLLAGTLDDDLNNIISSIEQGITDKYTSVVAICNKLISKGVKISELLQLKFNKLMEYLHPDNIFKTVKMAGVELMIGLNNMMHSFFVQICRLVWIFLTSIPIIGDIIKSVFFGKICIPIPTPEELVTGALSSAISAVNTISVFNPASIIGNTNFNNLVQGALELEGENLQIVSDAKAKIGQPYSVSGETIASTQNFISNLSSESKDKIQNFFQSNFSIPAPSFA